MASRQEGASARTASQQSMFDSDESAGTGSKPAARGSAHMDGTKALERLRDRIDLTIKELGRLRAENGSLRKELKALQKAQSTPSDGSTIHFNESPAKLREEIQSLIDAIDDRIEHARESADH